MLKKDPLVLDLMDEMRKSLTVLEESMGVN